MTGFDGWNRKIEDSYFVMLALTSKVVAEVHRASVTNQDGKLFTVLNGKFLQVKPYYLSSPLENGYGQPYYQRSVENEVLHGKPDF